MIFFHFRNSKFCMTIFKSLYRVRTLNPTLCKPFRKKCVKISFINIFMPNLQILFIWIYYISLLRKFAASLHLSLNPRAEPPEGLEHGVPSEVAHHLRDLRHQRGRSVVGGFVDITLTNAPYP